MIRIVRLVYSRAAEINQARLFHYFMYVDHGASKSLIIYINYHIIYVASHAHADLRAGILMLEPCGAEARAGSAGHNAQLLYREGFLRI